MVSSGTWGWRGFTGFVVLGSRLEKNPSTQIRANVKLRDAFELIRL